MKIKTILTQAALLSLLGISSSASAGFDFGSPFDVMNNNDNYNRYDRGSRDYRGNQWDSYDQWEPNYWRYRYFDGDSPDSFFDGFNGDSFNSGRNRGRGRGDSSFDMNADSRYDGRYDGRYEGDNRYRGERSRRFDYAPPRGRNRNGDNAYYGRSGRSEYDRYRNENRQRYDSRFEPRARPMSETPERRQQRAEQKAKQPTECR